MVTYFGMSEKVGNVSFYDSQDSGYNFQKPYSEKTAELIDAEVKTLINNSHEMAHKILTEHFDGFNKLANLLLEREVVFQEDLVNIFGPRQGAEKQDGNEAKDKETAPESLNKEE